MKARKGINGWKLLQKCTYFQNTNYWVLTSRKYWAAKIFIVSKKKKEFYGIGVNAFM